MTSIQTWIIQRGIFMRIMIGAGLGGLAALAMPPTYLFPILFPSLVGLYWLVQTSSYSRFAFFIGWAFGAGHFYVGLYWISNAFLVDASRHAMLAAPAVFGLSLFLGVWIGLACWFQRKLINHQNVGIGGVMVFASFWTAAEWVRSWAASGFPWNLLGSVWAFSDHMIQPAAYIGTYGLSLLTILVFCSPAIVVESINEKAIKKWHPIVISLSLVLLIFLVGTLRLSFAETGRVPDVMLRLVQPNIPQDQKWKKNLREQHVLRQMDMSMHGLSDSSIPTLKPPTHVIWAETAVPFILSNTPKLIQRLASVVPKGGVIITGSLRSNAGEGVGGGVKFWNSMFAIGSAGDILATYDKVHLVPFGEYIPFKEYLPFEKMTLGAGQFAPGQHETLISVPGLPPFSPLICYEIIFPAAVVPEGSRPGWLLNITNDAWYGTSSGPYQHFVTARLRAIEEGLPVVRVANTGISGVVDGYGRIIKTMALGEAGVLDVGLPNALSPPLYGRFHNLTTLAIGLLIFFIGMVLCRRSLSAHKDVL